MCERQSVSYQEARADSSPFETCDSEPKRWFGVLVYALRADMRPFQGRNAKSSVTVCGVRLRRTCPRLLSSSLSGCRAAGADRSMTVAVLIMDAAIWGSVCSPPPQEVGRPAMVQEFNGKKGARGISDLRFQRRIGRCGSRRGSRDSSLTLRMTVSSRATDPHPGPLPGRERGIFVEARAPGTGSPWQSSPALRAE